MYCLKSKVRYSEASSKSELTYYALLNYLQDSSTLHSEELGESGPQLLAKNMAWILYEGEWNYGDRLGKRWWKLVLHEI